MLLIFANVSCLPRLCPDVSASSLWISEMETESGQPESAEQRWQRETEEEDRNKIERSKRYKLHAHKQYQVKKCRLVMALQAAVVNKDRAYV